jgi:hypothetical protein
MALAQVRRSDFPSYAHEQSTPSLANASAQLNLLLRTHGTVSAACSHAVDDTWHATYKRANARQTRSDRIDDVHPHESHQRTTGARTATMHTTRHRASYRRTPPRTLKAWLCSGAVDLRRDGRHR